MKTIINRVGSLVKYCTRCNKELNNENSNLLKLKDYLCNDCDTSYGKDWERKNCTTTIRRGKRVCLYGKKRQFPIDSKCEVCQKTKKLDYHHWDDSNLSKGIWCCNVCHQMAEGIDKGNDFVYSKMKEDINGSF